MTLTSRASAALEEDPRSTLYISSVVLRVKYTDPARGTKCKLLGSAKGAVSLKPTAGDDSRKVSAEKAAGPADIAARNKCRRENHFTVYAQVGAGAGAGRPRGPGRRRVRL
jgi:hypothetical protein